MWQLIAAAGVEETPARVAAEFELAGPAREPRLVRVVKSFARPMPHGLAVGADRAHVGTCDRNPRQQVAHHASCPVVIVHPSRKS